MTLVDFITEYPSEESCKQKLKQYRDEVSVTCSHCGAEAHYWKQDKEQYKCKKCKTRMTLRSGTVMHKSKLSTGIGLCRCIYSPRPRRAFQPKKYSVIGT
jgi:Zn finger protein HypA/HybF involved in hydrogenase expression